MRGDPPCHRPRGVGKLIQPVWGKIVLGVVLALFAVLVGGYLFIWWVMRDFTF